MRAMAQAVSQLSLMPVPSSVQLGAGQLIFDSSFSIAVTGDDDETVKDGVERFVSQLSLQTGIPFKREAGNGAAKLTIHAQHKRESTQKLGEDESYELTVSQTGAELNAPNSLGILHGLQTFLQLEQPTTAGFAVPVVTIKDAPRFAWRGLMIDVCRHFIPLDVLKRNVDGMAAVKLNVLHLHLSDHEGFRIESKKFPSCKKTDRMALITRRPKCASSSPMPETEVFACCPSSMCRATAGLGSWDIPSWPALPAHTRWFRMSIR